MNEDHESLLAARLGDLFAAGGFWRERWARAGVKSPPATLADLPVVAPEELAADEAAHPPYGSWRAAAAFVRVGVPARPGPLEMVVFSAEDLEREARVGAAALAAAGLAPGMRETNTLAGGLPTPGSLIVGDAAEHLGALDMPVGPIDAAGPRAAAWDFWSRVRPDFAVLDAAGARELAALLGEQRSSAAELGLRGAAIVTDLCDAEPEPAPPSLGIPIARIVGTAAAFSLLAARDPGDSDGAFFPPPDEVIVEVLDGRLVLTTLRHSAALVRFATGARAELVRRPASAAGAASAGRAGAERTGFRLV